MNKGQKTKEQTWDTNKTQEHHKYNKLKQQQCEPGVIVLIDMCFKSHTTNTDNNMANDKNNQMSENQSFFYIIIIFQILKFSYTILYTFVVHIQYVVNNALTFHYHFNFSRL